MKFLLQILPKLKWARAKRKRNESDSESSSSSSSGQIIKTREKIREKVREETYYVFWRYVLRYKIKWDALISISHIHRWIISEFQSQKYRAVHTNTSELCVWRTETELFQRILIYPCLLQVLVSVNLSGSIYYHLPLYTERSGFMRRRLLLLLVPDSISFCFSI